MPHLALVFTGAVGVLLILFDFQNVLSRDRRRVLAKAAEACFDFTIVLPVYGNPCYIADPFGLEAYKDNILIALDVGPATQARSGEAMRAFAGELEEEGWRVALVELDSPGPPSIVREVLRRGLVTTRYLIRMDCDTVIPGGDIQYAIEAMRRDGADICSVKTHARYTRTWCERFQALEYRMAMLSRHYRPWMLSGACLVGKTDVMLAVLEQHSDSYFGEDSETGRIAHARRLRVRHLDVEVATEVPRFWGSLFRQRRIWWTGAFRHTFVNFDKSALHHPVWMAYYLGLAYFGVVARWYHWLFVPGPVQLLEYTPLLLGAYVVVTLVSNWQVRHPLMLVYPVYALVQSTLFPWIGAGNYVVWALRNRRLGRYAFPRRRRGLLPALPARSAA